MKNKLTTWFQVAILSLGTFLLVFSGISKANAAEQNDVINEISIKNSAGEELTKGVDIWESFRLQAKFVLPDNQVHAGDTTTIQLPTELAFKGSPVIDLTDENQEVVAKGVVDEETKTITLTYTDYVEKQSGVRGEFFFYVQVDNQVVKEEKDIPINITVGNKVIVAGTVHYNGPPKQYDSKIEKSGWTGTDPNIIHYNIALNRNMENMQDVSVQDSLSEENQGVEILPETVKIYKVAWYWDNGTWGRSSTEDVTDQFTVNFTNNNRQFSVDFGDVSNQNGYLIEYSVKTSYNPTDGELFTNNAILKANQQVVTTSESKLYYLLAGGMSEGYVFSINLHKQDEAGNSLAGAQFEVVRDRTGVVVGTITTDDSGNASVGQLLRDNYTIREVKAPDGYTSSGEEIKISSQDFGSDKAVARTVINQKATVPTQKVTFSKVNLDGQEIAGAQIKIFKGDKAEGTALQSWTSEANQSKEIDLETGVYTFHEEAAPTGYLAVTDITFQVNSDATVTVLNANSNAVEYKNRKLVITDQKDPKNTDSSDSLDPTLPIQPASLPNQDSTTPKDLVIAEDPTATKNSVVTGDSAKSKRILPSTGTLSSVSLISIGFIIISIVSLGYGVVKKK